MLETHTGSIRTGIILHLMVLVNVGAVEKSRRGFRLALCVCLRQRHSWRAEHAASSKLNSSWARVYPGWPTACPSPSALPAQSCAEAPIRLRICVGDARGWLARPKNGEGRRSDVEAPGRAHGTFRVHLRLRHGAPRKERGTSGRKFKLGYNLASYYGQPAFHDD